jgi:ketosteroid isomerase-like protein
MAEEQTPLVRELIDREKIREVVHRYCWAVDRGTLEEVMSFFHDDPCELKLIPGKEYIGRAAVQRWYDAYLQNRMEVLRHLIHNQIIMVMDEDNAISKSYFDAVGDLRGESIVAAGFYEDTLLRVRGKWKFTHKVIKLDFIVPLREGWGGALRIKRHLVPPDI